MNDIVKKLEKIAKYAQSGSDGFAIHPKYWTKLKDDLEELCKEKVIKPFLYDSIEEVEEEMYNDIETFGDFGILTGMPLFDLTKKGANELKKAKDDGELDKKEYDNILSNLGWHK